MSNKRTEAEIRDWLVEQLSENLGLDPKDFDTSKEFTRYGMDSMDGVNLAGDLEQWLGCQLSLNLVWEHPTVDAIAAHLAAVEAIPLEGREGGAELEVLPLSLVQQRLWAVNGREATSSAMSFFQAYRIEGALDVDALTRSLEELLRRHEALRTSFSGGDDDPGQSVNPARALALAETDLSLLPGQDRLPRAELMAREERDRPFDLTSGEPPLRLRLVKLSEEERVLMLCAHHLILDALSMGTLFSELAVLYPSLAAGGPSPLPLPAAQQRNFVSWQQQWLEGEAAAEQRTYWEQTLQGAQLPLALPTDRPREEDGSAELVRARREVPNALFDAILTYCRDQRLTPHALLAAAWAKLLGQRASAAEVVLGTQVFGRGSGEFYGSCGCFADLVALRLPCVGELTEVIEGARAATSAAFARQELPFGEVERTLYPDLGPGRTPLTQVLFDLFKPMDPAMLGPCKLYPFGEAQIGATVLDLELGLTVRETMSAMSWELLYDAELYDEATAEGLLEAYEQLLADALG